VALLSAMLTTLAAVALNAATGNPVDLPSFPAPLRPIQQNPWVALLILTAAGGLLAWAQTSRSAAPPVTSSGPAVLPPAQSSAGIPAEQTKVRRQLLDQVRRTWIEGVLDRSLAKVAHMELGLVSQPGAVVHPWGGLLHRPDQPDELLPPGTPITQVTDRLGQHLLVLGDPGAGKTTLLLEYAADLLQQADRDAAAPIPVVFHLSAWPADEPPLEGWLVDELALRYGVSRRLAVALVAHDLLAVLLDGLDEVPQGRRGACVAAINAFRREHGGVPLVVCTRSQEYHALAAQLTLNGAVEVQPLDRRQVQAWLAAAGRPLAGVRTALRDADHWLWELLNSPLLLSIVALTYKDQPASAVRARGSVEVLLGAYVDAMLARARAPLADQPGEVAGYADADTLRWLGWLAERMGAESVFYPDWIQPGWLPTHRQRWLATTGLGLAAAIPVGLVYALMSGLIVRWLAGLSGLIFALLFALTSGLMVGLGMRGRSGDSPVEPIEPTRWVWSTARAGLVWGLVSGMTLGLLGSMAFELTKALTGAPGRGLVGLLAGLLGGGLVGGLALVLGGGFESRPNVRPTAPLEGIRAAAQVGRSVGVRVGLVYGLGVGLGIGLLVGLGDGRVSGLGGGLVSGLGFGLGAGLLFGLIFGLRNGGASYLRHSLLIALLRRQGLIPADLIGFLDYADGRILLRRAGGGYLFIHRLLQDHFATRTTSPRPRPLDSEDLDARTTVAVD
jgi:eukaryotic-like serine/threonine-protein kinase